MAKLSPIQRFLEQIHREYAQFMDKKYLNSKLILLLYLFDYMLFI